MSRHTLRLEALESRAVPATVTSLLDDNSAGTLRAAIADTPAGGTVDFAPGLAGTIQLDRARGNLRIDKSLTVAGPGAAAIVVRGSSNGVEDGIRVFNVDDGTNTVHTVTISGLTVAGGYPIVTILQRPPRPPITNKLPGGGVFNAESLELVDCVVSQNTASTGGGIYNSGTLTATRVRIHANEAQRGGGIENVGTAHLRDSTVSGNSATLAGEGGGAVFSSDALTAERCTFSVNYAFRGGGLWITGGTAALTNCTISGNTAGGHDGGGIKSTATLLSLNSCTITANAPAGNAAAGMNVAFGVTDMVNCVIAGNAPTLTEGSDDIEAGGAVNTTLYIRASLIGRMSSRIVLAANEANITGTQESPVDARLGPLADNGGPTLTHALLPDSPAMNAGSNELAAGVTTDQRGVGFRRRFGDRVDMGAVEFSVPSRQFAAGAGAGGGPQVTVYAADGSVRSSVLAFEAGFAGGVRTATGDVTGDGIPDVIVGSGPGRVAEVRVFDGASGRAVRSAQPFADFTGGTFLAAADFDGDGFADVAVTPDEGGGGRVVVYDGRTFAMVASFLAIDDANFRGGCRPAAGDVDGDGTADLVVSAGFGGGPRVAVFDGSTPTKLMNDFFAFEQELRNGAYVAVGDVNGDGKADLILGGGPGGGPRVRLLDAAKLLPGDFDGVALGNFFAGNSAGRTGVRVAAADLDGDARADVVVGDGAAAGSRVATYLASAIAASGTPAAHLSFDAFPGFAGGVFVG